MNEQVSVIIVNHNGRNWLGGCLDSVLSQTRDNLEVIVVDNASTDGSVEFVRSDYPEAVVIECADNIGYAGGNNLGLVSARGKFILILNNDARLGEGCIEIMKEAFTKIPELGIIQPKIIVDGGGNKLDSCGCYWTDTTVCYTFGYGKDADLPIYNEPRPLFSINGAVIFTRMDVIEKTGLFDEDFWCFYEEIDLCHRAWLAGYQCWYYPAAVAVHAREKTSSSLEPGCVVFHDHKNRLASMMKNLEWKSFARYFPLHLMLVVTLSLAWLVRGQWQSSMAVYRAIGYNIWHLRRTLKKRGRVQSMRRRTDVEMFRIVKKNPALRYYRYLLRGFEGRVIYED